MSHVFKRLFWPNAGRDPFILELPDYKRPSASNILFGLVQRAQMFLHRAGTTILAMMLVIWCLASLPRPPEGAEGPAISYSFAAKIGHAMEPVFAPIGFNWQINVALIPGMAAREVAVASLGTVYAIEGAEDKTAELGDALSGKWSLATALALLAWYVFAPQCASTLATIKRETGSWGWAAFVFFYMFALAYGAAFITFQTAAALGLG
jgi:ferrous iron transport protein B